MTSSFRESPIKKFGSNYPKRINPEEEEEKQHILDRKTSPKSVREVLTTMSFAERRDAAIRKI